MLLSIACILIARARGTAVKEEGYTCNENIKTTKILTIAEDRSWEEGLIGI